MSDIENTSQMSLEVVDETPATGNSVSGNTDSLSVQELMSNIGNVVSELVKQELNKVNHQSDSSRSPRHWQDGGNPGRSHHVNNSNNRWERDSYSPRHYEYDNPSYYDRPFSRPDTYRRSDRESYRSSSHQDPFCREDLSVKVKPFNPKETDWFTYKIHFEAVATQAAWSERTKCTRLMNSLTGKLLGVVAGLPQPILYQHLINRLDAIHGISNSRDDAILKLSNCPKQRDESIPMFAERVRQLVERAHPNFIDLDKDEQALRYFLQGLPPKHDLRLQMRMQNFRSLQEAAAYGAQLEQVMYDEQRYQNQSPYNHRSLSLEEDNGEFMRKLEKLCNEMTKNKVPAQTVPNKSHQFGNKSGKSQPERNFDTKSRDKTNSACFICGAFGHWRNECPKRVKRDQMSTQKSKSPLN